MNVLHVQEQVETEAGLRSSRLGSVARQVAPTFVALQFNVAALAGQFQLNPTKSSSFF